MEKEDEVMERLDGRIPKTLKDKARKDSKDMFGKENITGFIKFLIQNYESKK